MGKSNELTHGGMLSCGSGKKALLTLFLFAGCCVLAFCADSIGELDSWGDKIMGVIKSGWVRAICALAFAIESGACIFAAKQGEGGAVKRFLPWMIGTIGLLSASSVSSFFFDQSGSV